MIKIMIDNLTLIISDDCPADLAQCAINALARQRPKAMASIEEERVTA